MSSTRTACNPKLIDEFISDQLSETKLRELEEHLSVCELCQSHFNEQLSSLDVSRSTFQLLDEKEQSDALDHRKSQADILRSFAAKFFPPRDGENLLGRIDQFELVEPIGSGGMGLVYKAFDRPLNRYVALKVLSPTIATTGAARQRFIREAQAAAAIHSPYVVPIYAVSEFDGLPYIVMRFESGVNLQQHIDCVGPLSIIAAIKIAHQIAVGLVAAHQQSVVHRDVKPANIMLEPSVSHASLTDFGLAMVANDASLTHSGMTPGTPSYMSPEQAAGQSVDHRSDWYSLGCVLYSMLVGHPPFRGQHAFEILSRLQKEAPKKPSHYCLQIPPWIDRLVMMLLAKRPEERLSDGKQIVDILSACALHLDNPSKHELPRELIQRNHALKSAYVTVAALILMILGYWMIKPDSPEAVVPKSEQSIPDSVRQDLAPSADQLQVVARYHLEQLQLNYESDWRSLLQLEEDISAQEIDLQNLK